MDTPSNYGHRYAQAVRSVWTISLAEAHELVTRLAVDSWPKQAVHESPVEITGRFLITVDGAFDWPCLGLKLVRGQQARTALLYPAFGTDELSWKMQVFASDAIPKRVLSPPALIARVD